MSILLDFAPGRRNSGITPNGLPKRTTEFATAIARARQAKQLNGVSRSAGKYGKFDLLAPTEREQSCGVPFLHRRSSTAQSRAVLARPRPEARHERARLCSTGIETGSQGE